jgi:ubiquinone/menaquinone biosynthesis C-methylase UbiE
MYADHLSRYFFAARYASGKRVLDVGTGPGYGASILKHAGATCVQAIDIDPATVAQAERAFSAEGISFVVDDSEKLQSVTAPVDLVCSFENIEHLRHPEQFLRSAARVLSAEGCLIVSTPDRSHTPPFVNGRPANPHHTMEWYAEEFKALLSHYFGVVEMYSQVASRGAVRRQAAVANLNEQLRYLWSSPGLRLKRGFARLFGRQQAWPDIWGLSTPSIEDYPIHPATIAPLVGRPSCHVAVCTAPQLR